MRYVVGVADMKLTNVAGDIIVTHALGSCLGVAIHDPVAKVGGLLHYMLPTSTVDPEKALRNPMMFGDTGIPLLFTECYKLGADKSRLRVSIAGGAQVLGNNKDLFAIGQRNELMARKLFWKNKVLISGENVGGSVPRTMYLDIDSGSCWLMINGQRIDL